MCIKVLEEHQNAVQALTSEIDTHLSELKNELTKIEDETTHKFSLEEGVDLVRRLNAVINFLPAESDRLKLLIRSSREVLNDLISRKKNLQKYLGFENCNDTTPVWTISSYLFIGVGIIGIAFFCFLEAIAISTLLEYYVPGFAGEKLYWKRIAVGSMAIAVNLAIKIAIERHESHRLKNTTRNIAMASGFIFLILFFFSFFGEQFLIIGYSETKSFILSANENISDTIQLARMTALFLASFAGAYLFADIPAREIRVRNGFKRLNPEYQTISSVIDAAKLAIRQQETEARDINRIIKRTKCKRERLWIYLVDEAKRQALIALKARL